MSESYVVIPLAGPDFISEGKLKALLDYNGGVFLFKILESRPWYGEIPFENYTFVFFDCTQTRNFAETLKRKFTGCSVNFISRYTQGAALSVLNGLATTRNFNQPIIVDLADIDFMVDLNISEIFQADPKINCIAPYFVSSDSSYSYFSEDQYLGVVDRIEEKKVISDKASTGIYIFRDFLTFLKCITFSIDKKLTFNDLYYVAPIINGLVSKSEKTIQLVLAKNVVDIKKNNG
jgi:hypothetical protein